MKSIKGWQRIVFVCVMIVLIGSVSSGFAAEGKWDTAGEEIKEASHAVGEATEESAQRAMEEARKVWEEAKLKSKETLDAAKKKYDEEMEKAKAMIHEATVPKTDAEADHQGDTDQVDDVTDKPAE